jgi:hypothetical protein
VDLAQFGALGDQGGPDALHHPVATPALEPAVDGGVVAELLGQVIPLAATAEAMDNAVDDRSPVLGRLPPFGAGLPVLPEDGLDTSPQPVVNFPDGIQPLGLGTLPCHEGSPSVITLPISRKTFLHRKIGSEIVSYFAAAARRRRPLSR